MDRGEPRTATEAGESLALSGRISGLEPADVDVHGAGRTEDSPEPCVPDQSEGSRIGEFFTDVFAVYCLPRGQQDGRFAFGVNRVGGGTGRLLGFRGKRPFGLSDCHSRVGLAHRAPPPVAWISPIGDRSPGGDSATGRSGGCLPIGDTWLNGRRVVFGRTNREGRRWGTDGRTVRLGRSESTRADDVEGQATPGENP